MLLHSFCLNLDILGSLGKWYFIFDTFTMQTSRDVAKDSVTGVLTYYKIIIVGISPSPFHDQNIHNFLYLKGRPNSFVQYLHITCGQYLHINFDKYLHII